MRAGDCAEYKQAVLNKKRLCNSCKKTYDFIFLKKYEKKPRNVFVDLTGSMWNGKDCPRCNNDKKFYMARLTGRRKSIDDVTAPSIKKGRQSERLAEKYLILMGMTNVKLTTTHGPDIIFTDLEGNVVSSEIKTVIKDARCRSYYTQPVSKNRMKDDFFIAIFPCGKILMETMSLHLTKTTKCGSRNFTKEVIEYGK